MERVNLSKIHKPEDLKRSPDLLNNVKIGQCQLRLIMKQILFYNYMGGSSLPGFTALWSLSKIHLS